MKSVRRGKGEIFVYFWQRRTRGFIGIRVGQTHAWVIVGDAPEPEKLLVIGPGPRLPIEPGSEREEFREVYREVAAQHPELERFLKGEISFDAVL
jgi:hypothetical protein